MLAALEDMLLVLADPDRALARLQARPPGAASLQAVLLCAMSLLLGVCLGARVNLAPAAILAVFLCLAVLLLFAVWAESGLLHLSAGLLGGNGRRDTLSAMLVFSLSPFLFFLPAGMVSAAVSPGWLLPPALGILFWTLALTLRSIGRNYRLTAKRTALALCAPHFFLAFAGAGLGFLALAALAAAVLFSLLGM